MCRSKKVVSFSVHFIFGLLGVDVKAGFFLDAFPEMIIRDD